MAANQPDDRLYFRQLLSGRDFAVTDPMAQQMVNFVYAIGDRATGECLLVDPAYAIEDLLRTVYADGMQVTGALATHYHPDHVGGWMGSHMIEGIAALLEYVDCPIHVQRDEVAWVERTTEVGADHLAVHDPGDVVSVGAVDITLIHTPGHTPGSQCFHVDGRLVSGDTLFLNGCGRTDLPGSNAEDMYYSLQKLAAMPSETIVYPGHRYSQPSHATLDSIRDDNYVLQPKSAEEWMQMFAG
jgi:hydroxyacylglutathione hydrolase